MVPVHSKFQVNIFYHFVIFPIPSKAYIVHEHLLGHPLVNTLLSFLPLIALVGTE